MPIPAVLSLAAAYFSLVMAAVVLLRDKRSFVHCTFAVGMLLFAGEEVCRALSSRAILPGDVIHWQKRLMAISGLVPGVWLGFSVSYARANYRETISRWYWFLAVLVAAPILWIVNFRSSLFIKSVYLQGIERLLLPLGRPAQILQIFFLLTSVFIVFNLERTLRSSTGRIRWQIKFMALGAGGLFALRIYLATQALLFSRIDTGLGTTSAVALLAANVLFAVSLSRARSLNTDVYLSRATIQNSLTIILAGTYLVAVGVAANLARSLFPAQPLPLDAIIVFLALTGLAVLIFSNRLRQELRRFVTRNFRRPIYDYRSVWMDLTQRTTSLLETNELSAAISKIVSECLEILSVNVWLVDETEQKLRLAGSTALSGVQAKELENAGESAPDLIRFLRHERSPADLEEKEFEWPAQIMRAAPDFFRDSKMRYAIGLHAGGELVGVMTLNDDRVGHETLSGEDLVLLETLAAQLAASLLNLKLSGRLREAGKVEAFQTVSTFFVHDLKNLASRLSLTMQNLPEHFDDPEFRADALRVISASLAKIDGMCSRLTMLRENVDLRVAECDLNQLVTATLDEFNTDLRATVERKLRPVPRTLIDQEQIHKVLTNLVMNANDAVNGNGVIQVMTFHEGNTVSFAVTDNGCGMSAEFIEKSLFRPFQTTKKKGLGIGLFHSKLIIEAHRGKIEVNSAPGKGTEFRVVLPVA